MSNSLSDSGAPARAAAACEGGCSGRAMVLSLAHSTADKTMTFRPCVLSSQGKLAEAIGFGRFFPGVRGYQPGISSTARS